MKPKHIACTTAVVVVITALAATVALQWRHSNLSGRHAQVLYDTTMLRSGDLLFRNGLGNESLLVTSTSNGDYSHVGIAMSTPSGWHVVHAVPGEAAQGQPDLLKCEPIAVYYAPDRAMAGAWARVDCSNAQATNAARAAMHKVDERVLFDNMYDMDDTTSLYCTELVRLSYLGQGIDLSEDRYAPTPGIGLSGHIIYPEHLWVSGRLKEKKTFDVTY